ncbi:MAG: hypothetical protein AAFU49_17145 [Pseudomonadota bacterium]
MLAALDRSTFTPIFAAESGLGFDGDKTNDLPRVDTNFDRTGYGDEIAATFTQFGIAIRYRGVQDLRVLIEDLYTGDEDIAFDNLLLTGEPS